MKLKIFLFFLMGVLFIPNFVLAVNQNTHSIDFESSSSQYAFITDANQTGLDLSATYTFEAWVKPESLSGSHYIINKWKTESKAYAFLLRSDGKVSIDNSDDGTSNAGHYVGYTTDEAQISTGVWTHIAASFDVASEVGIIYINGESVAATKNGSMGSTLVNGSANFQIGSYEPPLNFFDGLIDEVRVWNDIRTEQEILDNMNKELVGNEAGLVGYWKFNNNAEDTTANNNDLTIANSPSYSSDYAFEYDPNPDPDPTPTTTPTIATEDAHIMNTILLILAFILGADLLRRIFTPLDKKRGL